MKKIKLNVPCFPLTRPLLSPILCPDEINFGKFMIREFYMTDENGSQAANLVFRVLHASRMTLPGGKYF